MSLERYQNFKPAVNSTETAIKRRAIPSWEEVSESLELRTHNNPLNSVLLDMHRNNIKDYYNHVYGLASGRPSEEPAPHWSDPRLSYHFRIVRESVSGKPEKFSKGYKKAVRKRKEEERRASK